MLCCDQEGRAVNSVVGLQVSHCVDKQNITDELIYANLFNSLFSTMKKTDEQKPLKIYLMLGYYILEEGYEMF